MEVNSQLTTDKALRDYQLVCRAREDGDQRAYADLMRMYKEPIYLLLLKMTNNPTEADDYRWATLNEIKTEIEKKPDSFTYWFKEIIGRMNY